MQIQRYKIACIVNIQSCDVQYVEGLSIEIVYFLNGIFRDVSLRKNPRSIPLSIKGRFDNKQETNRDSADDKDAVVEFDEFLSNRETTWVKPIISRDACYFLFVCGRDSTERIMDT